MKAESINLFLEISKLVVAIAGAIFVAWYWNRKKHLLDRYLYLDESYNALLKLYFDYPQFGDRSRTDDYANGFKDTDAAQYHYFAMRVHTLLETIFDLSKGNIPEEWKRIFQYHATLHARWLKNHRALHEPGYVELALRTSSG